jgi:hypothetical protein
VILGSVIGVTEDVVSDSVRWLGMTVGDDSEIHPRTKLVTVPYAFRVSTVDGATGGIISGDVAIQSDLDLNGDLRVTGRVGIGAGDPAEKLHVNGDIRLSSGGDIAFVDDNTRIYETGNDLVLTADDDVFLMPDDDVYIAPDGGSPWIQFDPGGQKLGIGTTAPLTTAHVRGSSLSLPSGAIHYDEFILEDADAILGLYSGTAGPAGSAVTFGEVSGGALVDKWAIIRETSGGGKGLRVTYGTGKDQFVNTTMMYLDSSGNVGVGTTSPHSRLQVNGSLAMKIKTVTAEYHVTDSDRILVADASGGWFDIFLPSAVGIAGRVLTIKCVSDFWHVNVWAEEGELIDHYISGLPVDPWEYITLVSDGSKWLIIGGNVPLIH